MNTKLLRTVSPIDGSIVAERPLHTAREVDAWLSRAQAAQKAWASLALDQRRILVTRFIDCLVGWRDDLAREITVQMGRPIGQSPGEKP